MKRNFTFFAFMFLAVWAFGQTPMFLNTATAGGANTFPFANSAASRKVQWFIPPNSLGGVTAGNNITKVWFQAGSTASQTYPIFTIKLKTGSGTGLTGTAAGPVEPGMTVVYSTVNQTLSTTAGQWFGFTLQTPWLYNPNLPLIVEVEHNATTTSGPSVYQAVNIPGPGNGRQWADYNVATLTGIGAQQVNFGIDVLPATPCTVAPTANTIAPSAFTTCPGLSNPTMSLATTYSFGGITYQWYSSTTSNVGPFTPVAGATMATLPGGTISATTWYNLVATCTNIANGGTTITPTEFLIGPSVVSTVPYFENFEGILINDRLPNCSWYSPQLGASARSYITSNSNNRIARSGTKFGSFTAPASNSSVYSNGITMSPGITYSAAIWYSTEYFGYSNWSDLTLLVGPNQSSVGQVTIASTSPAISGPYKLLSGVFTVPTQGDYFICIRANGSTGSALYLNYDDLSVTIPCDGAGAVNSPTLITSFGVGPFCEGDVLSYSASGADTYLWSNGDTNPSTSMVASTTTTLISVVGTNSLTGCTDTTAVGILVNPSPDVFAYSTKPEICPDEVVYLTAVGANSYAWSNGGAATTISVSPPSSIVYTVIGTASNGCSGTNTIGLTVKTNPNISATLDRQEICANESANIVASGGVTYQWYSNSSPIIYQGASVSIPLQSTTTFTVFGTGSNSCVGKYTVSQSVAACTGIEKISENAGLKVYPNPSTAIFNFSLQTGTIRKITVVDLSGKVLLEKANQTSIDISTLSAGIYYANIETDNAGHMVKIVKE